MYYLQGRLAEVEKGLDMSYNVFNGIKLIKGGGLMAILPILMYPDPILTTEAKPIEEINDDIRTLGRDMIDTMIAPPNMFPNRRNECESGLAISPTMFKGSMNGYGSINPFMYLPNPFLLMAKNCDMKKTSKPKLNVTFKSLVGDSK